MWQLERARRIVRRINHRQHDVDRLGDRLPLLSDLERAANGRDETEYVGGRPYAKLREAHPRRVQEFREHLRLAAPILLGEDLRRQTLERLRESDVIELDLAESHFDCFFGDAEVVLPDRVRVRIHPRLTLLVVPR